MADETIDAFRRSPVTLLELVLQGDLLCTRCGEYSLRRMGTDVVMSEAFARLVLARMREGNKT